MTELAISLPAALLTMSVISPAAETDGAIAETSAHGLSKACFWSLSTSTAMQPVVAEQQASVGFGGDSGGPDGEKVAAVRFRTFVVTAAG